MTPGQIAYEAMLKACNSPWPGWDGISEQHQGHWEAVAAAVSNEQRALLIRAADALDCHNLDHLQDDLIAELRKAAE